MPRVFVTTDADAAPDGANVLLNEQVASVHLSTGHAASQLIERLAWAISDAEDVEQARSRRSTRVVAALVPAPAAARESERVRSSPTSQPARRRQLAGARRRTPAAA